MARARSCRVSGECARTFAHVHSLGRRSKRRTPRDRRRMAGCRRCPRRVVVRRHDSAAGGATMTGEDFQASSRVTSRVSITPWSTPATVDADYLRKTDPPLPHPYVSFLSRESSAPLSRPRFPPRGFRAIRLSRVVCNLHSFLCPPSSFPVSHSPRKDVFSLACTSSFPRFPILNLVHLAGVLSPSGYPSLRYSPTGFMFPSSRHDSVSLSRQSFLFLGAPNV